MKRHKADLAFDQIGLCSLKSDDQSGVNGSYAVCPNSRVSLSGYEVRKQPRPKTDTVPDTS